MPVIDTSVAVKWVIDEGDSELAATLLDRKPLSAPARLLVEVANAFWNHLRRGEPTRADLLDHLAWMATRSQLAFIDDQDLIPMAAGLACDLGHPVHDCLYLALALRDGGEVITADDRFVNAAGRHVWLADRVRLLGA